MVYHGRVCNGGIEVEADVRLPEGAFVEISVNDGPLATVQEEQGPPLYEELKDFIGSIDDLPPDASVNLDHYLYGHPKQ